MKFKLQKSSLVDCLKVTQNIVGAHPTIAILANALVKVDDSGLSVTTTDLDITIKRTVEAECLTAGSTTVPAKKFAAIINEISDGPIEVSVNDKDQACIDCGSSSYKIICHSPDDFPPAPVTDGTVSFTIDRQTFAGMLRMTQYAASTDDSRHVLNGVYLDFSNGKLTCVATDGRRLALIENEVEFPSENSKSAILPSRVVTELLRIINGEGEIKIYIKGNQAAFFEFDNTVLSCKLIEGVYPNFRQVIPAQCDHRITIPREELLSTLKRIKIFTSDKTNAMRISFEDNVLKITANSTDVGEALESIAVKYMGPKIEATYNPEFMIDPLRNLSCDEVYIELNDGLSPSLIKSDLQFVYVLMPLRV